MGKASATFKKFLLWTCFEINLLSGKIHVTHRTWIHPELCKQIEWQQRIVFLKQFFCHSPPEPKSQTLSSTSRIRWLIIGNSFVSPWKFFSHEVRIVISRLLVQTDKISKFEQKTLLIKLNHFIVQFPSFSHDGSFINTITIKWRMGRQVTVSPSLEFNDKLLPRPNDVVAQVLIDFYSVSMCYKDSQRDFKCSWPMFEVIDSNWHRFL